MSIQKIHLSALKKAWDNSLRRRGSASNDFSRTLDLAFLDEILNQRQGTKI